MLQRRAFTGSGRCWRNTRMMQTLEVPIPDAARKNVFLTLHAIRTAPDGATITDKWLKADFGVGQAKHAIRVVRFLDLIDKRRQLKEDVLTQREKWSDFQDLIAKRMKDGCLHLGVEASDLFGKGVSWAEFEDAIGSTTAIAKRSARGKDAVLSCLRSIDEINRLSSDQFNELAQEFGPVPNSGRTNVSEVGRDNRIPLGLVHGVVVHARLAFEQPVQSRHLRRLAQLIEAMAEDAELDEQQ